MNKGKYVFAQGCSFLPQRVFDTIVSKYDGDYRIRHFSCWNQLLCMMYGQLSNRDSLSDLALTLNAHSPKAYHLGFGKGVSKANLGKSNANRDCRIYQDYAYYLIEEARKICIQNDSTQFSFSNSVYAFDSTTIDLCLNVFCWATFRRAKGAIKLHTQYDIRTSIPVFMHLTAGSVHDVNIMEKIIYAPGSFYVFDRACLDFERLFVIHESKSYFVIRAKNNTKFKRQYSATVDKETGVQCDQTGELKGFYTHQEYPEKIRRIKYYDYEQNRTFVFLTNNLLLHPKEIANLYKHRWKIELFFEWIKQHLKIKTFWGYGKHIVH